MKRRRFIQAVASVSVAPAALTQRVRGVPGGRQETAVPAGSVVELTAVDAAAGSVPTFFSPKQLGTLRRLADILLPEIEGRPGALSAGAPEFLDFLIGHSSEDRQELYRTGLDELENESTRLFSAPFSDLDTARAEPLLAPLRQPWTQDPAADLLSRFLAAAKEDVRTATVNSLEWNTAASGGEGRRPRGMGMYWYTIE